MTFTVKAPGYPDVTFNDADWWRAFELSRERLGIVWRTMDDGHDNVARRRGRAG